MQPSCEKCFYSVYRRNGKYACLNAIMGGGSRAHKFHEANDYCIYYAWMGILSYFFRKIYTFLNFKE